MQSHFVNLFIHFTIQYGPKMFVSYTSWLSVSRGWRRGLFFNHFIWYLMELYYHKQEHCFFVEITAELLNKWGITIFILFCLMLTNLKSGFLLIDLLFGLIWWRYIIAILGYTLLHALNEDFCHLIAFLMIRIGFISFKLFTCESGIPDLTLFYLAPNRHPYPLYHNTFNILTFNYSVNNFKSSFRFGVIYTIPIKHSWVNTNIILE